MHSGGPTGALIGRISSPEQGLPSRTWSDPWLSRGRLRRYFPGWRASVGAGYSDRVRRDADGREDMRGAFPRFRPSLPDGA